MKIAVLSPVAWRTPPEKYGPWEQVASNVTEGLVAKGHDVTLFATGNSITKGKLMAINRTGYEEDPAIDPKVAECMHIGYVMEHAHQFDIIHNHFDFLPLTYSQLITPPVITTIHGFSSPKILPVYQRYNDSGHYVSISNSDRDPTLDYIATVYNGIRIRDFTFKSKPGDYLLFFGRIHHEKGTHECIRIARKAGMRLIISGLIQDQEYFREQIEPYVDNDSVTYVGNSGPEKRDELLGGAYALLHPVNFEEPFGLSIAEALLCGTPVIAFNRGSMPELVEHGRTGFLVSSIDEAVAVLKEVPAINRADCREWAISKFSQEKMVEDYIQLYQRILGIQDLTDQSIEGHGNYT